MSTEPLPAEPLPARVGRDIAGRLSALLGADLLGVYLIGSGALGGFTPDSSDVDVAAIATRRPSPEQTEAIVDAVTAAAVDWPVRGVEFVLYPAAAVRTASAAFAINLNVGRRMPRHVSTDPGLEPSHWFVVDLAILRAHGVPLLGPEPSELVAPVPPERLLRALRDSLAWHAEHEAGSISSVLNACRAWRFVAEGVWSNKRDAGRWALPLADDPELVAAALAGRRAAPPPALEPQRVRRFTSAVLARLSRAGSRSSDP